MMATGITEFLNDLSLDPTSIAVLIIAWKFKAKEQCVFTRMEFIEGMKNCGWVNYVYSGAYDYCFVLILLPAVL